MKWGFASFVFRWQVSSLFLFGTQQGFGHSSLTSVKASVTPARLPFAFLTARHFFNNMHKFTSPILKKVHIHPTVTSTLNCVASHPLQQSAYILLKLRNGYFKTAVSWVFTWLEYKIQMTVRRSRRPRFSKYVENFAFFRCLFKSQHLIFRSVNYTKLIYIKLGTYRR